MNFDEEIAQIQALKKQALQTFIALNSQYLDKWTQLLEISQEIRDIDTRKQQRSKKGFSVNVFPHQSSSYHSLSQSAQFEERQRHEKLVFEHQADERAMQQLNAQWSETRKAAESKLDDIAELQSVFSNLSLVEYNTAHKDAVVVCDEESEMK